MSKYCHDSYKCKSYVRIEKANIKICKLNTKTNLKIDSESKQFCVLHFFTDEFIYRLIKLTGECLLSDKGSQNNMNNNPV